MDFYFVLSSICTIFAPELWAYHSCNSQKNMGTYINKGNKAFRDIVSHEYVDKTSLIPLINANLNSESRYSCVTRCRRFGKSMAAKMLCAYYDKSCDSRELFRGLKAEQDKSFETYLNKYNVLLSLIHI